jgi:NDP-sugar pyrophosphorylase family protein
VTTRTGDAASGRALPAVILAGGRGTRLGELTATSPKPLARVAGRPVLDWIIESLSQTGVDEVLLLAGYLGDQIADYVAGGQRWCVRARVEIEATPLGPGGALRQARACLPPRFLLVYGDSYLPIDYAALSRAVIEAHADAMMVVYEDHQRLTGVAPNVAVEGGRVTTYAKGAAAAVRSHIDAGVVALTSAVIDRLPPGNSALETGLYPALAADRSLLAYVTPQRFYDAGTPERLRELERALLA